MSDLDFAAERVTELKATGARVSVDDFGTGYSSLAYLQRLPVDDLKIDQRFVRALDGTPGPTALVKAIIDLGHALDLHIVAEGVESERHLRLLVDLGCDAAQDYHLGRPAPSSQPEVRGRVLLEG